MLRQIGNWPTVDLLYCKKVKACEGGFKPPFMTGLLNDLTIIYFYELLRVN